MFPVPTILIIIHSTRMYRFKHYDFEKDVRGKFYQSLCAHVTWLLLCVWFVILYDTKQYKGKDWKRLNCLMVPYQHIRDALWKYDFLVNYYKPQFCCLKIQISRPSCLVVTFCMQFCRLNFEMSIFILIRWTMVTVSLDFNNPCIEWI